MPSDNQTPSALSQHLSQPRSPLEALDITDALVRSAISSGASRIDFWIERGMLGYSHNGEEKSIVEIQSSWAKEAGEGRYDLCSPFGLEIAQLLFFASELTITSGSIATNISINDLQGEVSWPCEDYPAVTGMMLCANGVEDPWAFVLDDEGGAQIFRACPIPVFINGEEVPRISRANPDDFYSIDGMTVYVHLESAHLGYSTCFGGVVGYQQLGQSVVFLNPAEHSVSTAMEITVDQVAAFKERAASAFKQSVGQALLKMESEEGHDYIVSNFFPLLLRTFPGMLMHSNAVSCKVIHFPQDCEGADVNGMHSREMLLRSGKAILNGMPRKNISALGEVCTAFKLAQEMDAIYVHPDFTFPVDHWLPRMAMDIRKCQLRAYGRGNVVTPSQLLPGGIKLRVADHVLLTMLEPNCTVTEMPIYDWVLAEEMPQTRLDAISIANSGKETITVLYICRGCIDFSVPNFPFRDTDIKTLTDALSVAQAYMQPKSPQSSASI